MVWGRLGFFVFSSIVWQRRDAGWKGERKR